jgi:hypothetical protein
MTPDGTSKDDVKVPEGEIGTQISSGFEDAKDLLVTIVSAMGEEQVSFATPTFGYMCAYKLVGHLIQGSPERLLVHTPARLVEISCLFLVHLHFYAHPFIVLTDVIPSCMYFFHGLIQRVYCKVALSVLTSCMDCEVRLCLAVSCEKYSDEENIPVSHPRISDTGTTPCLEDNLGT